MIESSGWQSEGSLHQDGHHVRISDHPFFHRIRDAVSDYFLQVPANSRICFTVRPVELETLRVGKDPDTVSMTVTLEFLGGWETFVCRPVSDEDGIMTSDVDVRDASSGQWINLKSKLLSMFPIEDLPKVDSIELLFRWGDLPVELKESILQFAVCEPTERDMVYRSGKGRRRLRISKGPFEIVDQLGDWKSLLWTSRQVRAITLRLILRGNRWYDGGLCILGRGRGKPGSSSCHIAYHDALDRLNRFFQIGEADNSVPVDSLSRHDAKLYNACPRLFPHLDRYATFKHGIRKVYLGFDWKHTLYFWNVSIVFAPPRYVNCDSFMHLPHLDGVWITLPRNWPSITHRRRNFWHSFWHDEHPCPRMLHRLIYEQVARVCAHYGVKVCQIGPFLDDDEASRFWALHEKAVKNFKKEQYGDLSLLRAKFTPKDLTDLYEECRGGITLSDCDAPGNSDLCEPEHDTQFTLTNGMKFPLRCECDTSCRVSWDLDHMKYSQ